MKHSIVKKAALKALVLMFGAVMFAGVAKAGGDSFTIFLNGKQLTKQYVTQPLSLASLPITDANSTETLVVYYSHCGTIGKGRQLSVKDANGNVLKEWKFADAEGKDNGMAIPVKEILALQKGHSDIRLYYASQQLPGGRMLTSVGKHDKTAAALTPLLFLGKLAV